VPHPAVDPSPGRSFLTPGASPLRQTVERRSATVLVFLRGLPRVVPPLAVAAALAGGLLVDGAVGAACLAAVLLFFGWLLFLSWPALAPGARILRLAVMAVMVAGIGAKLVG
jgi:hypothetical protein